MLKKSEQEIENLNKKYLSSKAKKDILKSVKDVLKKNDTNKKKK